MSRNTTLIPKRISSIRFGLMDPTEIRKMSAVEVKTADTYKDDGRAYSQGLMDMHMGVIEPGLVCPTDNCKYDESPGHFGHIQLELPVIHIGFVNLIMLNWLSLGWVKRIHGYNAKSFFPRN